MYRIFNTLQEYNDYTDNGKDLVAGDLYVVKDGKKLFLETNNIDGTMKKYDYMGEIPPGYIIPSGSISISDNGTDIDVTQYAYADVAVAPSLEVGSFDANGEYYPTSGNVGYSSVTINVQPKLELGYFTTNGHYTPTYGYQGFNAVDVSVSGSSADDNYIKALIDGVAPTEPVELYIPDGTTAIPNSKFNGWTYLTGELSIPSSVQSIGSNAFNGCSDLTGTADIPSGVATVSASSFKNCSGLSYVVIPSSVTAINASAFNGCSGLERITINAQTPPTLANVNAFDNTNDCPIYVPANVVGDYMAASNWSSLALRLAADPVVGVTNTFTTGAPTRALTKILNNDETVVKMNVDGEQLPDVVQQYNFTEAGDHEVEYYLDPNVNAVISDNMFQECPALTYVSIADHIEEIGSYAFNQCSGLQNVDFSENTNIIHGNAFSYTGLTSVNIPDSVTYIFANAFANNDDLAYITMGSGITYIQNQAFAYVGQNTEGVYVDISAVNVPETAESIFEETNVQEIRVPAESVTDYENDSSWQQSGAPIEPIPVESTRWDIEMSIYGRNNTAVTLFNSAYIGQVAAQEIDGVTMSTFQSSYVFGDNALHTVKYNLANPTTLTAGLFSNVFTNIINMYIGNRINVIDDGAFAYLGDVATGLGYLGELAIGDSVNQIGNMAFQGWVIMYAWIGTGLTSIGNYPWAGADDISIRACYYPSLGESVFPSGFETVRVPIELLDTYQNNLENTYPDLNIVADIGDFYVGLTNTGASGDLFNTANPDIAENISAIANGYYNFADGTYTFNTLVYDIPSTVTCRGQYITFFLENPLRMPDRMFYQIDSIRTVLFWKVHYIGDYAFAGCTNLSYGSFGENDYSYECVIGESAFRESGLQGFGEFGFDVVEIKANAFRSTAVGYSSIDFGENIRYIGDYAFKYALLLEVNYFGWGDAPAVLGQDVFDGHANGFTINTYDVEILKEAWPEYAAYIVNPEGDEIGCDPDSQDFD